MNDSTFESLALDQEIVSALKAAGYEKPTEIQSAAIPLALKGRDLMATAQTGTGKTAAFALPILQLISKMPKLEEEKQQERGDKQPKKGKPQIKALILSPTRELAQQIEESLNTYSSNLKLKTTSVVGGLPIQKQIRALKRGVDILVATPGRLLDLMQRRAVRLKHVSFFVLDEADRMLDMGFVHDVKDIAKALKKDRQTLLFSATTSNDVAQLSKQLLRNPEKVAVDPPQSVGENIEQRVYFVRQKDKRDLMYEILENEEVKRALVFTTTKSNANVLAALLSKKGIEADAIHSDKNQKARQKALKAFDEGSVRVLVATDVMARGIDVDEISHVINYELPNDPESFVHRIGRTARAGSSGVAISLCDMNEVGQLRAIESFTKESLTIDEDHSFHSPLVATMKNQKTSPFAKRRGRRGRSRGGFRKRRA